MKARLAAPGCALLRTGFMTGLFPITASPSAALDFVKTDGLIPLLKESYVHALAFSRLGVTFSDGARSIFNVSGRLVRLDEAGRYAEKGLIG
jgi:hypothetical protein